MPFETSLGELLDSEKLMAATVREQHKDIDDKTQGEGLSTTRSTSRQGNPHYLTMYSLSEILQGLPAIVSDAEVIKAYQDNLDETVGKEVDPDDPEGPFKALLDSPGLLPPAVRRQLELDDGEPDALGTDGTTPEANPASSGGTSASTSGASGTGGSTSAPPPSGTPALAVKFIAAARAEIGTTEVPSGSNKNPYAAMAGHANGLAWCATFIAAMAKKVGLQLPSYSAATQTMMAGFKNIERFYEEAQSGDIAFYDFNSNPNDGSVHHVGIVVDTLANGTIRTIEGNTSSSLQGSQDNGGGVYEKIRNRNDIVGFGRPRWE